MAGRGRAILRLYRPLIHSKTDHASLVYDSEIKSGLSWTLSKGMGFALPIGAFRTNHIEVLYGKSGESPLFCNDEAKLTVLPHHPSCGEVFHPTHGRKLLPLNSRLFHSGTSHLLPSILGSPYTLDNNKCHSLQLMYSRLCILLQVPLAARSSATTTNSLVAP
jgi:hypothetical protein